MFSQTTRIPAKVYRSTDKNAPQLTAASGSLKTLLKACLVTGYGEDGQRFEPLGWEMPFEDGNNAVFRPTSPESSKYYLQCLNEEKTYATFAPYQNMAELMTGTGYFGYANQQDKNFAYFGNNATKGQWLLVGCDRAFWLVILDNNKTSLVLFFGETRPLAAADKGCCAFISSNYTTATQFDTGYLKVPMLATDFHGNIAFAGTWLYHTQNIAAYPDPIHGGLLAHDVMILEKNSRRAVLPALLHSSNTLRNLPDWHSLKLDGDDAEYIYLNIADSLSDPQCFLLNTSYFEYA